jgi:hypothetical protein
VYLSQGGTESKRYKGSDVVTTGSVSGVDSRGNQCGLSLLEMIERCGWSCGVLSSMLVQCDFSCLPICVVKAKDFDTSLLSCRTLAKVDDVLQKDITFPPV